MPDDSFRPIPHSPEIVHDQQERRVVTVLDGVRAQLEYTLDEHALTITHTGVPPAIGGRGVAGALVRAAVEFALSSNLKVVPACSYAKDWLRRHPEYADLQA